MYRPAALAPAPGAVGRSHGCSEQAGFRPNEVEDAMEAPMVRKPQLPLLLGVLGAAIVVAWYSGTFRLTFPSSSGWLTWHRATGARNVHGPGRPGAADRNDMPVRKGQGYHSRPVYPNGLPAVFPRVGPPPLGAAIEISGTITPCDKPVKVSLTRGRNDGRGVDQKERLATSVLPPSKTKYAFPKVPYESDGYGVAFEAEGYAVDFKSFFVKAGEASRVTPVTMVPCGRMEGRIFPDPAKFGPFPVGVAAMLDVARGSFPVVASLDGKRGRYAIERLKPGAYRIYAATLMGTSAEDQRAPVTEIVFLGDPLTRDERRQVDALLEDRMHPERLSLDEYDALFAPGWAGYTTEERARQMRQSHDDVKEHRVLPPAAEVVASGRRGPEIHLVLKRTAFNPVARKDYVRYSRVVLALSQDGRWQFLHDTSVGECSLPGAIVKIIAAPSPGVLHVKAGQTTEGPTIDISDWK